MIRLRIVGLFYDKDFDANGIKTIKDLLDEAQRTSGGNFSYEPLLAPTGVGIKVFTHTLKDLLNPTLGRKTRVAGRYSLSYAQAERDQSGTQFSRVWQYYVISEGRSVSNCYRGDPNEDAVSPAAPPLKLTGFIRFDQMPIRDRDEVIWRNVSIARNPLPVK